MGNSSSNSKTYTSNVTTTTTTELANAFNNALNTTQNFQNIGGVQPSTSGFGGINYGIVIAIIAALFGFIFLFKRKA